jgi:hypothetical protein
MQKLNTPRYKLNSACKLLIYKGFKYCFFSGHFNQSLVAQGFGEAQGKI